MNNIFNLDVNNIVAVKIFLEKRTTRLYVGKLTYKKNKSGTRFHLTYDPKYLNHKSAIPLGPELPLTKKHYISAILFPSFQDRIPSKENPAYADYCKTMGITPEEQNPIVLLATIGKKGPSSFMFEPVFGKEFALEDLKKYRQSLGLTLREFAALFGISLRHLQKIEAKVFSGKEILRRMEIYQKFPKIALYEILRRGGVLHASKKRNLIYILENQIKESNLKKIR